MTARQARVGLLSVLVLLTAFVASATLVITGDFVFAENCGPNLYLSSGWRRVLGVTSITPSEAGTTVAATHIPGGSGPDFAPNFAPAPLFPNQAAERS